MKRALELLKILIVDPFRIHSAAVVRSRIASLVNDRRQEVVNVFGTMGDVELEECMTALNVLAQNDLADPMTSMWLNTAITEWEERRKCES
jgi:hypothetical protein